MSVWTAFRNSIEDAVEPEIEEGINFFHVLETLVEGDEVVDLENAAKAGAAAAIAATGTLDVKLLAAITAFATALVGEAVTVIKSAAVQAGAPPAV